MVEFSKLPDNFADRPDAMLGESQSSYLTSPRRKKRTSWLPANKEDSQPDEPESPASRDLQSPARKLKSTWLSAADNKGFAKDAVEAPTVFASDDKEESSRNANSVVLQKLTALSNENAEIHTEKDESQVNPSRHSDMPQMSTSVESAKSTDSRASTDTTASAQSSISESYHSPEASKKKMITMQRKDINHMADRPYGWLGGEEPSPLRSPTTKLKTSWMKSGGTEKDDHIGNLKPPLASPRRKTSPNVLEKLSDFSQKNEENHVKNESLASPSNNKSHSDTSRVAKASVVSSENEPGGGIECPQATTAGDEKVSMQRTDIFNMTDRPETWMGGEGEEAQPNSYLQCPKTKLRTSWLKNGNEESQSLRDLTANVSVRKKVAPFDLNASAPSLSVVRKTSPMVVQKLSDFCQKNEEAHTQNEGLAVQKKGSDASLQISNSKLSVAFDLKKDGVRSNLKSPSQVSPAKTSGEKISMQRTDNLHMTRRPETWMGGEGEEAQPYSYLCSPKTKLRSSWLQNGTNGSQSLRDVFTGPCIASGSALNDLLNASDSNLFTAQGRKTSPLVMEKLLQFKSQDEANHKRNEEDKG